MPDFRTLHNRLIGEVPILDPLKARRFTNYAWRDARRSRRWSFFSDTSLLDIPALITTGTLSLTAFSSTAIPNAAAKAVLDALTLSIPITTRQLRVADGPLYQITGYDPSGAGTLTFTPSYRGATATSSYKIYKAYYAAPSTDFLSFTSIKDIETNTLICPHFTRESLDQFDPQRRSFGTPFYLAPYSSDYTYAGGGSGQLGLPIFELYPHPTVAATLSCSYERQGQDFSTDTDPLPPPISESTIIFGALSHAYRWCAANSARFPELRGVPYSTLMLDSRNQYLASIALDMVNDEESFPNLVFSGPDASPCCRRPFWRSDNSRWALTHATPAVGW